MSHLFRQILDFLALGYGTQGVAAASGLLTFILIFSVIIVGSIMNGIEKIQIAVLSKLFGVRAALFICNYVTIVGTIIHECAHALFAICTGAKVAEISFLDTKGDSLGHVSYVVRGPFFMKAIQHSLCACAPVFAGLVCELIITHQIFNGTYPIWGQAILWYLAISVMDHMSMSSIDIKHYFQGIWAVAPLVFAAVFLYGYFIVT